MCNSGNFSGRNDVFPLFLPPWWVDLGDLGWLGGGFGTSRGLVGAPEGLKSLFHPPGHDFGGFWKIDFSTPQTPIWPLLRAQYPPARVSDSMYLP